MFFPSSSLLIILLASLSSPSFSFDLTQITDTDSSHIVCIIAFLQKYFQAYKPLSGAVIIMSFTPSSSNIQQDILSAMHAQQYFPWSVVVREPNPARLSHPGSMSTTILHEKPQCYFVAVENLDYGDLEEVYEDWKSHINWNPTAQFVVYLTVVEENDQNMNDLMIAIMLIFLNRKVYNINVIGRHKGVNYFCGKTVFPYDPINNCGNRVIRIETLDICFYETPTMSGELGDEAHDGDGYGHENGYRNEDSGDDGNFERKGDGDGPVEGAEKGDINAEGDTGGNGDGHARLMGNEEGKWSGYEINNKGRGGNGVENKKGYPTEDRNKKVDGGLENGARNEETTVEKERDCDGEEGRGEERGVGIDTKMERNGNRGMAGGNSEYGEEVHKYTNGDVNENESEEKEDEKGNWKENEDKGMGGKLYHQSKETYKNREKIGQQAREKRELNLSPKIKLKELHSGLFCEKVPKDFSGCPIIAAYRSWEPYIFKEPKTDNFAPITVMPEEQKTTTSKKAASSAESKGYVYEDDYSESVEHYSFTESDTESSAYNDADRVNTKKVEPTTSLNGIEYKLLQTIAKVLNIKIDFQVEYDNVYMLFQQLIDGEVELIFGGIDEDPGISQYLSSVIPYHQDDLTWCVAKAERKYQLFSMFYTFPVGFQILAGSFIIVVTLLVCLAQKLLHLRIPKFRGIFATYSRIFGIILSQSASIGPVPKSVRIIFISTCFFSLMFGNFYQSVLVSTLTTPESLYQISHLEEIYQNRMTVTGSVDNIRHLNKGGKVFKYIRENFKMCYNIEDCLNHAATDERIAVAISRQHAFYNPRIQRDKLYCFDRNENIYMYMVTMLLPMKFHILHRINPIIQHVIESGHMKKWAVELDMKRKIREKISEAQMETVKELTLNQVCGTFVLHGMILSLALLIFLVELLTHWMVVKRRTRLILVKMLHRRFYEM